MNSGRMMERRTVAKRHTEESTINWKIMGGLGVLLALALAALAVIRAVDAQRPKGSDQQQIQALLLKGETAAEQRNSGALNRLISDNYRDSLGMTETQIRYQIIDYLRNHRSIDVEIPANSVQVQLAPDQRTGTLRFHARVTAQGESSQNSMDIDMTCGVAKEPVRYFWVFEGAEWKVTSADGYSGLEGI